MNHLHKIIIFIFFNLSSLCLAQFESNITESVFNDSVNGSPVFTKEIEFVNRGASTSSLSISVNKKSDPNLLSDLFSISLNRCINVRPLSKCKIYIRANYRGLSGSPQGTIYESILKFGSEQSIPLSLKVINTLIPSYTVSLDQTGLSFQVTESERRSQPKALVITNTGYPLQPNISLSNSNNFLIIVNRCNKILIRNESCVLLISYLPKTDLESTGTLNVANSNISLFGKKIITLIPLGDNSTQNIDTESTRLISFKTQLSQGNYLTWELINNPSGMTITQDGSVNFIPNINQIGSFQFQVKAYNSKGSFIKNYNLIVKPYIEISSLNFTEGFVGNNLIILKIKSSILVSNLIWQNLNNFIVPIRIKKDGNAIDNFSRLSLDENSNIIPINDSNQTSFIEISFDGAIKFKTESNLSFSLQTSLGNFSYSYPIIINGLNLPYIKYDIFAVKGNGSITGDNPTDILINMAEYRRVTSNWRVPIITRFRVKQIFCNGSFMDDYYGDNSYHRNCVSDNASQDSETAFWFRQTYAGMSRPIGGRAQGIQHGVVIEKSPWFYTLSHEIGHNLGLFHTFESFGNILPSNDYIYHKDPLDTVPKQRTIYSSLTDRGFYFQGDWINYLFNFYSNIISFIYNTNDDTPIDYYSSKKVSLYNNLEGCSILGCFYPNDPFRNGDLVYLGYESQLDFSGRSSGYVCELVSYNNTIKQWNSSCESPAILSPSVTKNIMSYWYKFNDNSAEFSHNQKQRMDSVLNYPTYQYLGIK